LLKHLIGGNVSHLALGDLEEQFQAMVVKRGLLFSRLFYWLQICPVLKNKIAEIFFGGIIMLNSYFKSAFSHAGMDGTTDDADRG